MNKTIYQTILERKLNARKKKDTEVVQFLTFLQGEFERAGKDIDDIKALKILNNLLVSLGEAATRNPSEQTVFELGYTQGLVTRFSPIMLTTEDIKFHITQSLSARHDGESPTLGETQKFFKENFLGQYDGSAVTKVYKELYG